MKKLATAAEAMGEALPGTDSVSLDLATSNQSTEAQLAPARSDKEARTGRAWLAAYRRRVLFWDGVAVIVAAALVLLVRPEAVLHHGISLGLMLSLAWLPAVALCHGYEPRYLGSGPEEYRSLLRAFLLLFAIVSAACLITKAPLPRSIIGLILPTMLLVSIVARNRLRTWLGKQRLKGLCRHRTVAVGRESSVADLIREAHRSEYRAYEVVAVCTAGTDGGAVPRSVEDVPVHGTPADVLAAVDLVDADAVAVAADPDLSGHALRQLAWGLEDRQVELIVSPGILEVAGPRLSIRAQAGVALLHVERPVTSGAPMLLKSVLDRCMALMLMVVLLPLLLAVALSVRLSSPGPILYRQERVGAGNTRFSMFKFRSMRVASDQDTVEQPGADVQVGAEHVGRPGHADAALPGDPRLSKAGKDDSQRVTKVGRVLRRYSLDELPQLLNVLRGEMSLVGPRPPLPCEVAQYESMAMRRLRVQPGMTGLWQVSGRSDLDWEHSLRLDLWYVDNWSPMTDLQILARTARAVVRGTGAY